MAEMDQPPITHEQQEVEARIGKTIDIIASASSHRFTGFKAGCHIDEAGAIFVDNKKPEGQQETKVSMEDLSEAYARLGTGTIDDEKKTYTCQVGGQQKTVGFDRVFALTDHILSWKLGLLDPLRWSSK